MKLKLPSKKFLLGVLSVVIAIAVFASVVPALAAGSDPVTNIPGLGRVNDMTLIKMHKKQGTWFNDQDALLKEADGLAKAFSTLIAAEAKRGKNVSLLNNGLATFEAEVAACRQIHLVAGASIFSITGFKMNGDVRDRLAAGQQLLDGYASLKDAHFRLDQAMSNLGKSFVNWRKLHISGLPQPTPKPTATKKP